MKLKNIKQFILYTGASAVAMIVDLVVFTLSVYVVFVKLNSSIAIFISTVIARVLSGFINFLLSKKAFNSNVSKKSGIPKYFLLGGFQLLLSALLVILFFNLTYFSKTIIKCIVDFILYLVFYKIQFLVIFKNK
jgi:hypothetical protein